MQITNNHNLPDAIVNAIRNDPYDSGGSDYTVTQLIQPVRITHLTKRHWSDLSEDAMDRLWVLLGQTIHAILERADADNALQEERVFTQSLGRRISGAADIYHGDGVIQDFKVTSAWTAVYGSRAADWERQLNLLAHLFRSIGLPVRALEIICLYRDWSAVQALNSKDYPRQPMHVIPVRLWPEEQAELYLKARVALLIGDEVAEDGGLSECTSEEMWEKHTTWAVMKNGRKRAVRVLDSEDAALRMIADGAGMHVEKRPGRRVRCEEYCPVNAWCSQYRDYSARQEQGDPDSGDAVA